jgi:negative regulator of replication initiation
MTFSRCSNIMRDVNSGVEKANSDAITGIDSDMAEITGIVSKMAKITGSVSEIADYLLHQIANEMDTQKSRKDRIKARLVKKLAHKENSSEQAVKETRKLAEETKFEKRKETIDSDSNTIENLQTIFQGYSAYKVTTKYTFVEPRIQLSSTNIELIKNCLQTK